MRRMAECTKRARVMPVYLTGEDEMLLTIGCIMGRDDKACRHPIIAGFGSAITTTKADPLGSAFFVPPLRLDQPYQGAGRLKRISAAPFHPHDPCAGLSASNAGAGQWSCGLSGMAGTRCGLSHGFCGPHPFYPIDFSGPHFAGRGPPCALFLLDNWRNMVGPAGLEPDPILRSAPWFTELA